jgi:hypothetical protein
LKLYLAVIVLLVAGAVLWIEHGHRIDLATSTGEAFAAPVAAVCSDSENVPYSKDCIAFMQRDAAFDLGRPAQTAVSTTISSTPGETPQPACPSNNENVPYSAACIRFMSGWFWQANAAERTPPALAPK